jgi:PAT family beta-lactamase induction signal transducer AmpG
MGLLVSDEAPTPSGRAEPDPSIAFIGAFGFASGLPLPLTIFTLQQWFASYGLSLHAIGLTSLIGLAYTLKFLWSALFDRAAPGPLLRLGRRRGWLMLVQPAMAGACVALAMSDPKHAVGGTVLAAIALAFLSASQDILIDAWRIDIYPAVRQGPALAAYIWGYRGAMLVAGSGVIYLSTTPLGWRGAYLLMAGLMTGGMVITALAPDPGGSAAPLERPSFAGRIEAAFLAPLRDFLARPGAWPVLAFIVLFRLGHMAADTTAAGFYSSLHFDSHDVAVANFLPQLAGTLAGAAAGGWLVARLGRARGLLLTGTLQALSLGLYLMVLAAGHDPAVLSVKVGLEELAHAAADTAFLTYLSALCSREFSATQYALLSSLAALALHTLGGLSGYAAEALGYRDFYVATILAGFPALLILRRLSRATT